jgi:mRNA interferase RelE/StbE
MTASDDDWDWQFTEPAERDYEKLQPHEQERIVSKLDDIVNDQ